MRRTQSQCNCGLHCAATHASAWVLTQCGLYAFYPRVAREQRLYAFAYVQLRQAVRGHGFLASQELPGFVPTYKNHIVGHADEREKTSWKCLTVFKRSEAYWGPQYRFSGPMTQDESSLRAAHCTLMRSVETEVITTESSKLRSLSYCRWSVGRTTHRAVMRGEWRNSRETPPENNTC